jgi:hypothetical protein
LEKTEIDRAANDRLGGASLNVRGHLATEPLDFGTKGGLKKVKNHPLVLPSLFEGNYGAVANIL